jgi:hypothetical protein
MALQNAVVNITTTATLLSAAETDDMAGQTIQFTPPSVIYVGPAGVTSATGYALQANVEYIYDLPPGNAFYAAVASGTTAMPVFRVGV